jgi:hypothetical protein
VLTELDGSAAAVVAQNTVLIGQIVQVTTDGLRADGKLLDQLFGADVSLFFTSSIMAS